jgi:hypothetical protein
MRALASIGVAAALRAAALVLGAAVVGEVVWFLALYPLVPSTGRGWVAAAASGLAVTAWAATCIVALVWLERQQRFRLLFRAAGALLAVSLGVGVFGAAYEAREFITANASYFAR